MIARPTHLRLASPPEPEPEAEGGALFDLAFREHYAFIHRTLAALGVAATQVDDAAQEVFLVLLRRQDDVDRRLPLRAWLYGVARRVAHDFRRAEARRSRRIRAAPAPDPAPTPEHALARREASGFIAAFLDGLDEEQREVFVLVELEGLSAPEVVDYTGIKLNTVYSRLRRARRRLEDALARQQREEERRRG